MEWSEIAKYIDSGVLFVIVVLFVKGYIVSKRTVIDIRAEMAKERETFKATLDTICQNHQKETKIITSSFEKRMKDFMKIIKVLKKKNGIK